MDTGFGIVALIACGMGGAVWVTDRDNPASRALGLFLFITGLAIVANALAAARFNDGAIPFWVRGVGFVEAAAFLAGTEWGLRVGRTVISATDQPRGHYLVRAAQALSLLYAVLAALLPELRMEELVTSLRLDRPPSGAFLLFAIPPMLAGAFVLVAGALALRGRPDKAEAQRITAMLATMPLLAVAIVLPEGIAPAVLALGELVFLVGALRYHVVQGARAQFMSQFLAPQVAELVRTRGLKNAMARQRLTVTVVCCDIRGFTAHAQGTSPDKVMRLLRDFYAAVGAAALHYGGTIKDLAGDGALILLGAPVPFEDAPKRALALARQLQARARPAVRRYSKELGLGVGVATGEVAVGIVGQGARYEYVAVGPAVNLASRLCDEARDGEIRIDGDTLSGAGEDLPAKSELRPLKGVGRDVPTYVLEAAA